MSKGWIWPVALVALLVGSAALNVAFVFVAVDDPSFAVERDYYQKALAWDQTMAQESRNRELGWSLDASLAPAVDRPGEMGVTVWVRDRDGARIDDANIAVEVFHNARASQVWALGLAAQAAGGYASRLPVWRPGLWELRVRVSRGTEVFTATVSREIGPGSVSP